MHTATMCNFAWSIGLLVAITGPFNLIQLNEGSAPFVSMQANKMDPVVKLHLIKKQSTMIAMANYNTFCGYTEIFIRKHPWIYFIEKSLHPYNSDFA